MKKILLTLIAASGAYLGYSQCPTATTPTAAPWIEGFEFTTFNFPNTAQTANNCWLSEQVGTSADWRTNAGFTGSGGTGPSGSFAGGRYAYLETSGTNNPDSDTLWSPYIDMTTLTDPQLKFYYHMHGADMGTMTVEINDGTVNTQLWTISGEQQADETSPWDNVLIDLTPYANDTIRLRFIGLRAGGFTGDMAIDNVAICEPTFSTISEVSCGYYVAPSGAEFHDAGTYTDTIANVFGCDSIITINLTTNNIYTSQTFNDICGTFDLPNGGVIGADGAYTDTLLTVAGCDSVITYNLTFANSTSSISVSACNVYTAPSGVTYTLSGTYSDTIMNAVMCDSIITIDLEMFFDQNLTIFETTCGEPYTSDAGNVYNTSGLYEENYQAANGCDSTVYIDLLIAEGNNVDVPIQACDEWTSPTGALITTSGTYPETFQGVTGCDSTRTYMVTINTINDVATLISALTIEAAETGATSYQWVDCNNNNMPITGANSQIFIASFNGDYACLVTNNGCTAMTNCVRVASLGIENIENDFSVYPNPSNGVFVIEMPDVVANSTVTISNAAGQIVYTSSINNSQTSIDLSDVEAGMYFISITNETGTAEKSIVVE